VSYPKFKNGEAIMRNVRVSQFFTLVNKSKLLIFFRNKRNGEKYCLEFSLLNLYESVSILMLVHYIWAVLESMRGLSVRLHDF